MKKKPGIFNDVIGPVMRGPSSSHTAASWRIARICLAILNEPLKEAIVELDKNGAWAPNYKEQGTTMGMNAGLLGLEITDDRMKNSGEEAKKQNIQIQYKIGSFKTDHANTVRLTLTGWQGKRKQITGVSLGGGAFEIRRIDEFGVTIQGDSYELLLITAKDSLIKEIVKMFPKNEVSSHAGENIKRKIYRIKFTSGIDNSIINQLMLHPDILEVISIPPILPVIAASRTELPFEDIPSLLRYSKDKNLDAGQLGLQYEKCNSGLSKKDLIRKMEELTGIIHNSIKTGLSGTSFQDRILHQQSQLIGKADKKGNIPHFQLINSIIANVTAIMESKSAMEVIVANPTAGSCGTIGGVLKAIADEMKLSTKELVQAYFAAGLIGVFFAMGPGFSAEEHGCQVECGAASGMAAAGIVQLYGGTAKQSIDAASMAIQNMIGLVCDPVADRVELPCLGKNISAALNALTSATMTCAGYDSVIPLEEVIETVSQVSKQMPDCVKCTGKGGLAITPTALSLKDHLKKKNSSPKEN